MNLDKTVFSHVMDFLPLYEFRNCVARYQGDYKVQSFSCLDQYLCLAFAQLTYRESLRDIEACLRSVQNKLYHMGIRGKVSRSTLADANETRDWRIYADFAQHLIHIARKLYLNEDFGLELSQTVYALDATTIDLCLSLFHWAPFRQHKAAVKLHTLLDLRGNRVADGVYETLLDGMEIGELKREENIEIKHYLFVDDYFTWWDCGRSYLCRLIDIMHMGYVDEVIFGKEIIERIPTLVKEWISYIKRG